MRLNLKRGRSGSSIQVTALEMLPLDGDLNVLVERIASARQRPIVVTRLPLPPGISGLWDERSPDEDFVVVDDVPMAPSRYAAVLCHELAHIVLGHHGIIETAPVVELIDTIDDSIVQRFLKRCAYDDQMERDAEELATALTREHRRRTHNAALKLNRVSLRLR